MIGPTTNGAYVCRDLGAISPLGRRTGSWVAGAPKTLTSRPGVTLAIYPICHTDTIIPPHPFPLCHL